MHKWCYLGDFQIPYVVIDAPQVRDNNGEHALVRTDTRARCALGRGELKKMRFCSCSDKAGFKGGRAQKYSVAVCAGSSVGSRTACTRCPRRMESCLVSTQDLDQRTGWFICAWSKYWWYWWHIQLTRTRQGEKRRMKQIFRLTHISVLSLSLALL